MGASRTGLILQAYRAASPVTGAVMPSLWSSVVSAIVGRRSSVRRTSHDLLGETLRDVLRTAVDRGPGTEVGTAWRASAALYALLGDHPIDHRGRCRSCRRQGARIGRARRRCRVFIAASYWLRQPDEFLLRHLAHDLKVDPQTPAVPPPPSLPGGPPRAGRPEPDHGGAGEPSAERPRPRRDPPDDRLPPGPEMSLMIDGGGLCQT